MRKTLLLDPAPSFLVSIPSVERTGPFLWPPLSLSLSLSLSGRPPDLTSISASFVCLYRQEIVSTERSGKKDKRDVTREEKTFMKKKDFLKSYKK
jgi:hypothetical protein